MTHWFSCPCTVLKPSILHGQDSKGQREEKNLFSLLYLQAKLRNKFYVFERWFVQAMFNRIWLHEKGGKYFVSLSPRTHIHWPSCKILASQTWLRREWKAGRGWRTSRIGELIYYSPNNIAELAENCSNNPVSLPVTPQIPLPRLFCRGHCFFSLEGASWNCYAPARFLILFSAGERGQADSLWGLPESPSRVDTSPWPWATVPDCRGAADSPAAQGSPASLPVPPPMLPAPWGLHSKMPLGHRNPSPFSAVTRSDSGWWRGRALGKCAEILPGIPCAARLARSVLFEDLAILVPNKESVGAGQGVELIEVED